MRSQKIKFLVLFTCAFVLFAWPGIKKAFLRTPKLRVAVFAQEGFPAQNSPQGLGPELFEKFLEDKYPYSLLDAKQLCDPHTLNADTTDLLVLPYGESFPVQAFGNIAEFLQNGGGLFTTGGTVFSNPLKQINGKWEKDLKSAADFEKLFLTPLGLKYYRESTRSENAISLWPDFMQPQLPTPPQQTRLPLQTGGTPTTSQGWFGIVPSLGNVFDQRIQVRDFVPVLGTQNQNGLSCIGLSFVKSWKNPYDPKAKTPAKWMLCTFSAELNPIAPATQGVFWNLRRLFAVLACPVTITAIQPDMACYKRDETPKINVTVQNTDPSRQEIKLELNLTDTAGVSVFTATKKILLNSCQTKTVTFKPDPQALKDDDFFTATAQMYFQAMLTDKAQNAVLFKPAVPPALVLQTNGKNFALNGSKVFLKGTNYYESKKGELNWINPDLAAINRDFAAMAQAGVKMVRVHYHPPRWFWDRGKMLNQKLSSALLDREPANLPDEKYLRILDAHIILANRHGIVFCPDIFTLVPNAMGSVKGWKGLSSRITDSEKVKLQNEFVRILAKRYKDTSGISWDLWNEPELDKDLIPALQEWVKDKVKVFRGNEDAHLITLGGNQSKHVDEFVDYVCVHTGEPQQHPLPQTSKPVLLQEVWLDFANSPQEELKQAKRLQDDLDFAQKNTAGYMPWQWCRQARLWEKFSPAERWDDQLGCITRSDATLKPSFEIFSNTQTTD